MITLLLSLTCLFIAAYLGACGDLWAAFGVLFGLFLLLIA